MIWRFALLCFGIVLLARVELVYAEPDSPLLLARGLRNQGMADLAVEYLEELRNKNIPEVAKYLPLELARSYLDLASQVSEEAERTRLLKLAQAGFDEFVKNNPKDPLLLTAILDSARLEAMRGKNQFLKSRRTEDKNQAKIERRNARPFFERATKRFEEASKQISEQLKTVDTNTKAGKTLKQELETSLYRAKLDEAINLYDLGHTYDEQTEIVERGKWILQAKAKLERTVVDAGELPIRWTALAWAGQCDWELDVRAKAEESFNSVLTDPSPQAVNGIRLTKAFKVRHSFEDISKGILPKGTGPQRYISTRRLADEWTKTYSGFLKTPEGVMVRYIHGMGLLLDAEPGINRDKQNRRAKSITDPARGLLRDAQRIFKELMDFDNEYTERATRRRLQILLTLNDADSKGEPAPAGMKTFEEAYLQAQITHARFNELALTSSPGDPGKSLQDKQVEVYQSVIGFLDRALELANEKDPPKDIYEAKVFLAFAYQNTKQYLEAGLLAEHLAKSNPKSRMAPAMAALAVNSYLNSWNKINQTRREQEGAITEEDIQADVRRIKQLARLMEAQFPDESATDLVRQSLGYFLQVEKNYPEAIKTYMRIDPSYSNLGQARLEQGAALFSLVRGGLEVDPKSVPEYAAQQIQKHADLWNQTIRDLNEFPLPPASAAISEAQAAVQVKLQLGLLLQLEGKQYARIEQLGKSLVEGIPKLSQLGGSIGDDLLASAKAMQLTGLQGQTAQWMKDRNYAKVMEMITPVLATIKAEVDAKTNEEPSDAVKKLRRAQRDVLTLALRLSVQDGQIDKARQYLETLQKASGEGDENTQILLQLVGVIRGQMEVLKREKKEEESKRLIDSFTAFLDTLAKQEKSSERIQLVVANGYTTVEQFPKAIQMLEKLQAAPAPMAKDDKAAEDQRRFQLMVEYTLARTYRLSGEAGTKEDLAKAEKILNTLIGDGKTRGPGFNSLEIRKERPLLLEAKNAYQLADREWNVLIRSFVDQLPAPGNDKQGKRPIYFDLFVEQIRCRAKAYFVADPVKYAKAREDNFTKLAAQLVEVETKNNDLRDSVKDRIREILDQIPPLKEKYLSAGGKLVSPNTTN